MCQDVATLGFPLNAQPDSVKAAADAKHEPFNTQIVAGLWEWQEDNGWLPFDAPVCDELESAWQSGSSRCKVSVEGKQYDISFTHMWQQNCASRTTRPIRRSMYKEAPVWYWWDKDGGHRLSITATTLIEQEYQKLSSGGHQEPHEVIWTVEGGGVYDLNTLTMQLVEEGGAHSYPITRTLIKADISLDADTDIHWGSNRDVEEADAALLQVPLKGMDSIGSNRRSAKDEAARGNFSSKTAPADQRRPSAEPSLRISVEGGAFSLQVFQGDSTTIHVAAPQQMGQQRHPKKKANQNHFSLGSSGGRYEQIGGSSSCCSCKSTCCGSGPCAKVKSSCHLRCYCCCCGCCGSNASKEGSCRDGNVAASDCDQCSQRQGESAVVDTAMGRSQVNGVRPDDGISAHYFSSSAAFSINSGLTEGPEAQQPQAQVSGRVATLAEQQLVLQWQALELQHSHFLIEQEERTKRQIQLEQQQQALHLQQQQLIDQLQLQLDDLTGKQTEVREQQRQLVQQHREQQLLLLQQAGEMEHLRSSGGGKMTPARPQCKGKQQNYCLAEATGSEANPGELILNDVEPPTRRVSFDPSTTPAATDANLSPDEKEHGVDDEYTCI